jgi:hypothetical protein
MTTIDRRAVLTSLLGGAVAASAGLALIAGPAESAPFIVPKGPDSEPEYPIDKVIWVRRRRWRRVCWWHRGRRICRLRRW